MQKPESIKYKIEAIERTIEITKLTDLRNIPGQGLCLYGGEYKGRSVYVAIENKPELKAKVEAWVEAMKAYEAWKKKQEEIALKQNVPGLEELRVAKKSAAYETERFFVECNELMDDELNDGANPPAPFDKSKAELFKVLSDKYPRAALYLTAEDYTLSQNYHKFGAGEKAQAILASGGNTAAAKDVLDHWLPESAMWD